MALSEECIAKNIPVFNFDLTLVSSQIKLIVSNEQSIKFKLKSNHVMYSKKYHNTWECKVCTGIFKIMMPEPRIGFLISIRSLYKIVLGLRLVIEQLNYNYKIVQYFLYYE